MKTARLLPCKLRGNFWKKLGPPTLFVPRVENHSAKELRGRRVKVPTVPWFRGMSGGDTRRYPSLSKDGLSRSVSLC